MSSVFRTPPAWPFRPLRTSFTALVVTTRGVIRRRYVCPRDDASLRGKVLSVIRDQRTPLFVALLIARRGLLRKLEQAINASNIFEAAAPDNAPLEIVMKVCTALAGRPCATVAIALDPSLEGTLRRPDPKLKILDHRSELIDRDLTLVVVRTRWRLPWPPRRRRIRRVG